MTQTPNSDRRKSPTKPSTANPNLAIEKDAPILTAFDDPVPSCGCGPLHNRIAGAVANSPHQLEADVHRALLDCGDAKFSELVVRQMPGGVCLQGTMELTGASTPDLHGLVQRAAPVTRIINQLLIRNIGANKPR